jgi:hypothetical protein
MMAGTRWYDLMGKNHTLLSGVDASFAGWRPTTRPGGGGQLVAAAYLSAYTSAAVKYDIGSGDFTIACAVTGPISNNECAVSLNSGNAAIYASLTGLEFGVKMGGTDRLSGTPLSNDVWYRLVASRRSGTLYMYVNGRVSPNSYAETTSVSDDLLEIGDWGGGSAPFGGSFDDVAVWNRGLSSAEILQDYNLSRAGYPGVLLREGDNA